MKKGSYRTFFFLLLFPKGGSDERRSLPDCVAAGDGVCGLQHRRLLRRKRVHHGQRPQGPARSRRRGQASVGSRVGFAAAGVATRRVLIPAVHAQTLAGPGLPDHLHHRAPGYAEAARGVLALAAQLPPRDDLLLRRLGPRPTATKDHLPQKPHPGGMLPPQPC